MEEELISINMLLVRRNMNFPPDKTISLVRKFFFSNLVSAMSNFFQTGLNFRLTRFC